MGENWKGRREGVEVSFFRPKLNAHEPGLGLRLGLGLCGYSRTGIRVSKAGRV